MELNETNSKFSEQEINEIREVSTAIYKDLKVLDNRIITKNFIFNIFLALISSIPIPNIISYLNNFDGEKKDKHLVNLYDEYLNLKQINFNSKNFKIKTKVKYDYYEAAFKKRIRIQNITWDYAALDKDVTKFIQARETVKITYIRAKDMVDKKYFQCPTCSTKWLDTPDQKCPRCSQKDELSMFIKISNILCVLGDMETFYKELDKTTKDILYDNWKHVLNFFENKRNKRKSKLWSEYRSTYGLPQYEKIIKPEGGDWRLEPEMIEFNKKYNVAFVSGSQVLDFTEAKNLKNYDIIADLNKLNFPFCCKLRIENSKLKINDFKPQMIRLEEIYFNNCHIKDANLESKYFPNVRILDLQNNLIESYDDIKNLINIESLRIIVLIGNPIETKKDIYISEDKFKQKIEIRYDPRRKYPSRARLEESDSEIKELINKNDLNSLSSYSDN